MNQQQSLTVALRFTLALLLVWMTFSACGNDDKRDIPDVSDIKIDFKLRRFDQDLLAIDTNQIPAGIQQLNSKYPDFFPLYAGQIIRDQTNPNETPEQAVRLFLTAPQVRKLQDTVQQVYGDLGWLEKDLHRMFQFYKYYFPKKPVPEVVTMVSVYATDAFTAGDSLCGIGLDMYLGENYPDYLLFENTAPAYLRRQFKKEYITIRLAKALAQNIADVQPNGERLLDQMLHNGKQLYIADLLLPEVPDSLKMGYTREQMEGCYNNEAEVWARLLDEKMLYSTDARKLRKLISPSPNAPVVFQEAPGEIGNWMGWQIVKAWMARNPNATIEQMLAQTDAQKFLEAAKYKPKRR